MPEPPDAPMPGSPPGSPGLPAPRRQEAGCFVRPHPAGIEFWAPTREAALKQAALGLACRVARLRPMGVVEG